MNVIYFMIPVALLLAGGFVAACIWALSSGQFDDLDTPALRMLKNDELINTNKIETVMKEIRK